MSHGFDLALSREFPAGRCLHVKIRIPFSQSARSPFSRDLLATPEVKFKTTQLQNMQRICNEKWQEMNQL
jgi:hypothetical protein